MKRRATTLLAAALALGVLSVPAVAEAKREIKLATLAPKQSPWGKIFRVWAKAIEKKTEGRVGLRWYWNGIAGPEKNVVGKIRTGQLDGAAITGGGLMQIHRPIIALQMPGVFDSWSELDAARAKLRPRFDTALHKAGFEVTGWGDVGAARTFSYGFPVRTPSDLRGKTPVIGREDPIGPKIFEVIGGVTPRPVVAQEVLPLLRSHSIDVVTSPPLAVEQLQWAPSLTHMTDRVTAYGIGALVVSKKQIDKLPADDRRVVLLTGKKAAEILLKRIRKLDDQAYERLKRKMKIHRPSKAERSEWRKIWKAACLKAKPSIPGSVLTDIGAC